MRNYFNYFTEIEEHFSRQRGRHLFVSPLDWCLIELWKDSGIPLHVVLRGIDRSFESSAARSRKPPRTLYYCHPAVTEAFEEHQTAHVGAGEQDQVAEASAFTKGQVGALLDGLSRVLSSEEGESFRRAVDRLRELRGGLETQAHPNYEEVDRSLSHVAGLVAEALLERMGKASIQKLKKTVRRELRVYRKYLTEQAYEELFANYLNRKVIEESEYPSFSLFDLDSGG